MNGAPVRPHLNQFMVCRDGRTLDVDFLSATDIAAMTGLAANQVLFGSSTGGIGQSSGLTWNGTTFATNGTLTLTGTGITHTITSAVASTTSATGALTIAGGLGVTGAVNAGASSSVNAGNAQSNLAIGNVTGNSSVFSTITLGAGTGKFSFLFGVQNNLNNTFEVTPSTAAGGSTYSSPALSIDSNGLVSALRATASTSTATGALIALGGVGIAGALCVGGGARTGQTAWDQANAASELVVGRSGTSAITNATCTFVGWMDATHPLNASGTNGALLAYARNAGAASIVLATADTARLTLASTGEATFGKGVTMGAITNAGVGTAGIGIGVQCDGANAVYIKANSSAANCAVKFEDTNAAGNVWIFGVSVSTSNGHFQIFDVTGGANRLQIAKTTGAVSLTSTVASTSTVTGALIVPGGIGVAGQITFDGATTKSLGLANPTANAAVATTLGSVGPTGSTAGNPQGWMRVSVAGTDRYIPFW